jgi:hypothetical protein
VASGPVPEDLQIWRLADSARNYISQRRNKWNISGEGATLTCGSFITIACGIYQGDESEKPFRRRDPPFLRARRRT